MMLQAHLNQALLLLLLLQTLCIQGEKTCPAEPESHTASSAEAANATMSNQVRGAASSLELHGGDNLEAAWLRALRSPAGKGLPPPRIVPRVVLELAPQELVHVLDNPAPLARLLRRLCDEHAFDGLVLAVAVWNLPAVVPPTSSAAPAERRGSAGVRLFASTDLEALLPHVDLFSLNAYDASASQGVVGANAPLPWVEANLKALLAGSQARRSADRPLLGLNLCSTDFNLASGEVARLMGAAFSDLRDDRNRRPRLTWDALDAEHVAEYQGADGAQHVVYYPSLRSIQARLDARQFGAGEVSR
ncbi:hypothetical protein WJX81_000156 [Elliptochloris bilobata]|uniref:GH18 domain-containing protein n=1 Tax=Elliptochloris bilobata TaxID=381761 RepID=A0AAW1S8P5_9CHLO